LLRAIGLMPAPRMQKFASAGIAAVVDQFDTTRRL
jgi:hypothetical protein